MTHSDWKATRNARSRARLDRALPAVFPARVLAHALALPFVPPTPRLAIEAYWRHHPLRAEVLARALARRSAVPEGWTWRIGEPGLPDTFRVPPAPFREPAHAAGPGACCICGQPVFRLGWHRDLWQDGRPNRGARWHACCVAAWKFWLAPVTALKPLKRRQGLKCRETGRRLLKTCEVDHRTPLFLVWRDHRQLPWPDLLAFWGAPNLQVVNRQAHVAKSSAEAAERAARRAVAA